MKEIIRAEDLVLSYGKGNNRRIILDHINFSLSEGQIFGIVGLSGAGKTSLLRTFNLLNTPDSGKIVFDGIEITSLDDVKLREIRKKIGVVFQNFNLFRSKTVIENIAFPLILDGTSKKEAFKKVSAIAEELGLSHRLNAYPSQLSGGEQQRVAIARALITDPKLILLDEPTSSLDPLTTKKILNLVLEINERHNVTFIVVTHEMEVVKRICDSVAFLKFGKIDFLGSTHEFFIKVENGDIEDFGEKIEEEILPELIAEFDKNHIFRVIFWGENTKKPVLWETAKKFDIKINILYGKIEKFKLGNYGSLIIEVEGKGIEEFVEELRNSVYSIEPLRIF
ncbi:MAG: D-methionine transport system ATP-binding protein [Thermotogaceae bacterium]|nr:D-methionine transport system ATP-binding protein [Thermotogaceae bacterium]MDN5336985.1 D-methionine transport system ATP-binding protein [Thermotogaceae bacterium]